MWDRGARGAPDERNEWSNNQRSQGERPQPASAPLTPLVHDSHYAKHAYGWRSLSAGEIGMPRIRPID